MSNPHQSRDRRGRFAPGSGRSPGHRSPTPHPAVMLPQNTAPEHDQRPEEQLRDYRETLDRVNAHAALLIEAATTQPGKPPKPHPSPGNDPHLRDASEWRRMPPEERAHRIAEDAHREQYDKSGVAYIHHPRGVVTCLHALPEYHHLSDAQQQDATVAAYLHDVLEDSTWTAHDLRASGVSESAVRAVEALTAISGEPRDTYYARIQAAGPIAVAVKVADLMHNTLPARRAGLPGSPSNPTPDPTRDTYTRLGRKYAKAFQVLAGRVPDHLQQFTSNRGR